MRVLNRSARRSAWGRLTAQVCLRQRLKGVLCAPVWMGALATLVLALLNGELRTLSSTALERGLIALAQVGLLTALFQQTGLLRPTGLALRSPVAQSAREVGLLLTLLIGFFSVLGVRAAALVGQSATLTAELGFLAFAPLIAGGMLLSVLIHPLLALYTFAVLLGGIAATLKLPVLTLCAVGLSGWSASLAIARMRRRSHMFKAGALLSGLLMLTAFGSGFPTAASWLDALSSGLWGIATGIGAVALFWLGLNLLERPFRLATPMTLLELASLEQPLLRELREKAPGTYFHSQQVGQLAEEAALAIGADPLLARVAGYYHDIGKLTKPEFFIENQEGIENLHTRINPTLSARIIAAHVREGVDLARRYRLPTAVCDIIAQHHGTSLITYFYHQAVDGGYDPVLEQHFRYEGPKPQTREAAIVMLADTVEAASRVLGEVTPARLANFVHEMIEMRLQDGQLDECNLTFRDLRLIEEAFVRVLVAARHRRVEYPNGARADEEPVYAVRP
ncbi:MAG: HD domain-containing protein [Fimbriimonadales bacterium]|nr:HD domain-containing protein [Fimbriimonadales bacterium]